MLDIAEFRAKCHWIEDLENATELLIAWATEGRMRMVQTQERLDFESTAEELLHAVEGTVTQVDRRLEERLRPIQESLTSKVSTSRGKIGELLYDSWVTPVIESSWQTECTKGIPHSGDYIHTHYDSKKRVIVDVKNYTRLVPRAEVDKAWYDMEKQGIALGLLVSMISRVSGYRDGLDIEFRSIQGKQCCLMVVSNAIERKELIGVSLEILRRQDVDQTRQIDHVSLQEVLTTIDSLEGLAKGMEKEMTSILANYRKNVRCHYDTMKRIVASLLPDS